MTIILENKFITETAFNMYVFTKKSPKMPKYFDLNMIILLSKVIHAQITKTILV